MYQLYQSFQSFQSFQLYQSFQLLLPPQSFQLLPPLLPLFQLLFRFLKLRGLKYRISTERIEVASGVLSRSTRTYEAHQAKNISIHRPFPISFLGAAHLDVVGKGWAIRILGAPADHAEAIRDAVRESGRREAARADLIEWR